MGKFGDALASGRMERKARLESSGGTAISGVHSVPGVLRSHTAIKGRERKSNESRLRVDAPALCDKCDSFSPRGKVPRRGSMGDVSARSSDSGRRSTVRDSQTLEDV